MTSWRTAGGALDLEEPLWLGILNITPDSFSDGGRFLDPAKALGQARNLVAQGARALDLGAESTRPGAAAVSADEEWARLEPVLALLRSALPEVPLSLDTRHGEVAARGLRLGVAVINDVTGFQDPGLLHVARNSDCGLVAMRSRLEDGALAMPPYGGPGNESATDAVFELGAVKERLLQAAIDPGRILLDPGFGFGTTFVEDRALWEALPALPSALDWPAARFCIGISRKRFLAWRSGSPGLPPLERDALGARAHHEAGLLGYRVFRTHAVTLPVIRRALPEDAAALARVQVDAWRATYPGILPESLLAGLSVESSAAAFAESLAAPKPRWAMWALETRGALAGFAVAGPCRDRESDTAGEIHAIYLVREAWSQGLGAALMARALEGLREEGFREAVLWVMERNARGRRFYDRNGWELTPARRTEWQDGIALRQVQYRLALAPEGSGL
ncbi:dihydropteroate synthase [Geothrix sp. 21YS21S-2]|uniref:dihydropteroate synthase n=1 Tax=Geothrix sp. 21YS21S-2 TaxID=3068893 RepID=UPI0027BAABBF|nr:dihydropteroate synthase [Geothrix sp. 21YS21S-2]